ncbi:helix-turn-helix transcriptional regulator [Pseudomonas putida]|uniref:helix-turn-helix domain-containing protein n=1 Tax=Pseudomonas putida TaxID=303 RepID=UPI002B249D2D|nr:helix-turn-helix transcriptional regulator [Pseudomonas putida]
MTPDEAIGLAIKRTRVAQGLSQESIGASQSFVSDVERGKKSVTMHRLDEFAKALGISPATLMVKAELIATPEITLDELIEKIRSQANGNS